MTAMTHRDTFDLMTAKEKLRRLVEDLSEREAEAALAVIERRREGDRLLELLENAPADDEPLTSEEADGARAAKADIERGDVFSADQIKRELG